MANKALRLPVSELRKEGAGDSALFCLPMGGRDVLLSMADRLLWEIYQEHDGTRVILSDGEKAIMESTIEGLLMACEFDFTPIGDGLQAIADALENLPTSQFTCAPDVTVNCGSSSDFIIIPGPGENPIINPGPLPDRPPTPDDIIPLPDGYPTEPFEPGTGTPPAPFATWGEYDEAACAAANAIVEFVYRMMRAISDFLAGDIYTWGAMIAVIVNVNSYGLGVVFTRLFVLKIAEIVGWLDDLGVAGDVAAGIADFTDANREQIVCAMYQNRANGSAAANAVIAPVMNFAAGVAAWQESLPWIANLVEFSVPTTLMPAAIWAALAYENPNAVDCSTCEESEVVLPSNPDFRMLEIRPYFYGEMPSALVNVSSWGAGESGNLVVNKTASGNNFLLRFPFDYSTLMAFSGLNEEEWQMVGGAARTISLSNDTAQIRTNYDTLVNDDVTHAGSFHLMYSSTNPAIEEQLQDMTEWYAQFTDVATATQPVIDAARSIGVEGINGANQAYPLTIEAAFYVIVKAI